MPAASPSSSGWRCSPVSSRPTKHSHPTSRKLAVRQGTPSRSAILMRCAAIARTRREGMIIHSNIAPAGRIVLTVDDDPAVRSSLQFCLELEGFQVRTFASGSELLDEPNMPPSGCLVIDYRLPGMNGLELLAELRRRNVTLPAIVVTTHPSESIRGQTTTAGASLIEKPLLNEALFDSIRAIMNLQRAAAEPPAKPN